MASSKQKKEECIKSVSIHEKDTGSPEVQIALITQRIMEISDHLNKNHKDTQARHRLLKIVSERRKHLKYLKEHNPRRYSTLTKKLNIKTT